MSQYASQSIYSAAGRRLLEAVEDAFGDLTDWVVGLTDIQRLVGLCAFILVLFTLLLVQATTRTRRPGKTRSFLGSFVLVVVFSFLAGLLIDSRFDLHALLPANFA